METRVRVPDRLLKDYLSIVLFFYSQPLAIITLNYTRQIMKEEATAVSNEIRRHKRVVVADVLRGVAVMGIVLLHNIEHLIFTLSLTKPCNRRG